MCVCLSPFMPMLIYLILPNPPQQSLWRNEASQQGYLRSHKIKNSVVLGARAYQNKNACSTSNSANIVTLIGWRLLSYSFKPAGSKEWWQWESASSFNIAKPGHSIFRIAKSSIAEISTCRRCSKVPELCISHEFHNNTQICFEIDKARLCVECDVLSSSGFFEGRVSGTIWRVLMMQCNQHFTGNVGFQTVNFLVTTKGSKWHAIAKWKLCSGLFWM